MNMREEKLFELTFAFNERFGGVDSSSDGNEGRIYFRARKPDGLGRYPCVQLLILLFRQDKWWIENTELPVPIWESVRSLGIDVLVKHA